MDQGGPGRIKRPAIAVINLTFPRLHKAYQNLLILKSMPVQSGNLGMPGTFTTTRNWKSNLAKNLMFSSATVEKAKLFNLS